MKNNIKKMVILVGVVSVLSGCKLVLAGWCWGDECYCPGAALSCQIFE